MNLKFYRTSLFAALVLALVAAVPVARAATLTGNLSTVINGDMPVGAPPWLTATFAQGSNADTVRLTLTNTMSVTSQFIAELLFNANINPTTLTFSNVSGAPATTTAHVNQDLSGGNQIKAGLFNIEFDFVTTGPSSGNKFGGLETSVWDITHTGGLAPENFLLASAPKLDSPTSAGGWFIVADVRGIPLAGTDATGSGSIGDNGLRITTTGVVPEPETYAMMLAGLGLMGFVARRRKQKAA